MVNRKLTVSSILLVSFGECLQCVQQQPAIPQNVSKAHLPSWECALPLLRQKGRRLYAHPLHCTDKTQQTDTQKQWKNSSARPLQHVSQQPVNKYLFLLFIKKKIAVHIHKLYSKFHSVPAICFRVIIFFLVRPCCCMNRLTPLHTKRLNVQSAVINTSTSTDIFSKCIFGLNKTSISNHYSFVLGHTYIFSYKKSKPPFTNCQERGN